MLKMFLFFLMLYQEGKGSSFFGSNPRSDPRFESPINPEIQSLVQSSPVKQRRFLLPATSLDSTKICLSPFGFHRHALSCDKYYHCSWGKAYLKTCPGRTVWNNAQNYCDWPFNVKCSEGTLPSSSTRPTIKTTPKPTTTQTPKPAAGPGPNPPRVSSSCSGTICGRISSEPITSVIQSLRESTSCTLENDLVEAISPGSIDNPSNVKTVEAIFPETRFKEFFPNRNSAYTYINLLKAIGKYPAICSSAKLCPKILANMFAHIQQETAGLFYVEEINKGPYCAEWSAWVKAAYPCMPGKKYYGRGAKQLSWNYNYGAFSSAMFGDAEVLLKEPELVATTWLNFAASIWFFVSPQPPKPSMLQVLDGSWAPNKQDITSNLVPGFGTTTMIINGKLECGKSTQQAQNRAKYYREFAREMGVKISGEKLDCSDMSEFSSAGSGGSLALYWAPERGCKLVTWQTAYNSLVEGDYGRCKGVTRKCDSTPSSTPRLLPGIPRK